jgi:hypothetical protein
MGRTPATDRSAMAMRCAAGIDHIERGFLARIPVRSTRAGYCNVELKHPTPQNAPTFNPPNRWDARQQPDHSATAMRCAAGSDHIGRGVLARILVR